MNYTLDIFSTNLLQYNIYICSALNQDGVHANCCQPAAINDFTCITNLGEHLRNMRRIALAPLGYQENEVGGFRAQTFHNALLTEGIYIVGATTTQRWHAKKSPSVC